MRILHVITGLGTGGAERSLHNLLSGGLAQAHENHVLSLSGAGDYGPLIDRLGVPVHDLGVSSWRSVWMSIHRLRRIVRDIAPGIVQGWMYHGNLAALVARALSPSQPALAWNIRQCLYDISAEKPSTRMVIHAGRCWSRGPDAILYNSMLSRRQHESFGYAPGGRVIPNGFDTGVWRPDPTAREATRVKLGLAPGDRLVGFVGRFHPMKDVPGFLAALEPLMEADGRVHAALVGAGIGPDQPALATHLAKLPLERIHILGRRTDLPTIMAGFDVFCLSSNSEAFPNVLGEAMSCGIPCVATDVGDCAHLLGTTGLIVPSSDQATLSQGLRHVLSLAPGQRQAMGMRARDRIERHFSLTAAVRRYIALYEEMRGDR